MYIMGTKLPDKVMLGTPERVITSHGAGGVSFGVRIFATGPRQTEWTP